MQPETPEPIDALARLPRDLAIVKMENDNMMAMAAAHPRDYGEVAEDIKKQLATFKTFAQTAMYAKPVGKDDSGNMKYVRGLSIRAAEAILAAYKYNKVSVDVTPVEGNPDAARVEAAFMDFQTSRVWRQSAIVSKTFKRRNGTISRHSDDRFYNIVCKAEGSKLLRECVLRSVPPGLRSDLEAAVNEQLDSFLDESTVKKIVAQFSTKSVTEDMLEAHLGKKLDALDRSDRATLLNVWNAIDQGETTAADVFDAEPSAKPKASGNQAARESLGVENAPAPEPDPTGDGKAATDAA